MTISREANTSKNKSQRQYQQITVSHLTNDIIITNRDHLLTNILWPHHNRNTITLVLGIMNIIWVAMDYLTREHFLLGMWVVVWVVPCFSVLVVVVVVAPLGWQKQTHLMKKRRNPVNRNLSLTITYVLDTCAKH